MTFSFYKYYTFTLQVPTWSPSLAEQFWRPSITMVHLLCRHFHGQQLRPYAWSVLFALTRWCFMKARERERHCISCVRDDIWQLTRHFNWSPHSYFEGSDFVKQLAPVLHIFSFKAVSLVSLISIFLKSAASLEKKRKKKKNKTRGTTFPTSPSITGDGSSSSPLFLICCKLEVCSEKNKQQVDKLLCVLLCILQRRKRLLPPAVVYDGAEVCQWAIPLKGSWLHCSFIYLLHSTWDGVYLHRRTL